MQVYILCLNLSGQFRTSLRVLYGLGFERVRFFILFQMCADHHLNLMILSDTDTPI